MYNIREWFEYKKSEHTAEWGNKIIRFIRINKQPLVSLDEAENGMRYLLGNQNMDFIKALFQNTTRINLTNENRPGGLVNGFGQPISSPHSNHDEFLLDEMSPVNFKPLPIMEKLRNVLIAEMKKMGVVVNVRSEDPTSFSRKINDKQLLENQRTIEGLMTYCYTALGQSPYKMKDHKSRFGENPGNGNLDQFAEMGLDDRDPSDINFFMENFHKLDEEIAAESPIDFCMGFNRIVNQFEKWVNDIIAKKAVAATCYVSQTTGAIVYNYLAPETVYVYGPGSDQTYNDANAKGYERKVSIKEMLAIIGNSFDFETNWDSLIRAISACNGVEFTGVRPSYRGLLSGESFKSKSGTNYGYSQFMSFRVTLGYVEFDSQELEIEDGVKSDTASYYKNNSTTLGKYAKRPKWQCPIYKAHYLVITDIEQVLFDFGELPYLDIEGATDMPFKGTIITWKEIGDPIAIMAAPLLDIMNEAWFKFRYELRRAKPRGRGWNYEAMVSTLMDVIPDNNISTTGKLQKVMAMIDSSSNEIWSFPRGEDGNAIPIAGNQLNYDIPGGLSKETLEWWNIIISVGQYLSDLIGISDLRQGDSGGPRESMNNQFKALEYSQAATYYVPDMLTTLMQQLAIKTNFYVQDIVTYKDHNTMPYKFLEDGVGLDNLEKIEMLGKTSLHRFGIFVESLNQAPLRQELKAILFEAVKNKTISTAEYLLVSSMKNTKKAFLTFAHFEQRNKKIAQKDAQAMSQQQAEQQQALKKMDFDLEMLKQQGELAVANIEANAKIQGHLINQQGGLAKTGVKVNADREQVYHDAQADLLKQQELLNSTGKTTEAFPQPTSVADPDPMAGGGMGAAPPSPVQGPASVSEQLRQSVEPMPTNPNG